MGNSSRERDGGERTGYDRAVSPVIAVILLVAIAVILTTVLAVFVFGFGAADTGPTVAFEYEYNDTGTSLMVHHIGGDRFQSDQVSFVWDGNEATWTDVGALYIYNTAVTIGDGVTVGDGKGADPAAVESDHTVRIRWEREKGDRSATLDTWEGPDA